MIKIPCFLCGKKLSVRTDKNGKYYLICDPCGSQHFIRRKPGMDRLEELGHYFHQEKAELSDLMTALRRVQARLREIDALKKEVERLDDEAGIIFLERGQAALSRRRAEAGGCSPGEFGAHCGGN
jgi:DNA-directed RNA polymerase subunit RPC12/RpoP